MFLSRLTDTEMVWAYHPMACGVHPNMYFLEKMLGLDTAQSEVIRDFRLLLKTRINKFKLAHF